jgi:hypothetical protein
MPHRLVYLFTLANGVTLGYLVAAISPNLDVANAALPALVTVMLFFAGQLAVLDSIPNYWSWVPRCVRVCVYVGLWPYHHSSLFV